MKLKKRLLAGLLTMSIALSIALPSMVLAAEANEESFSSSSQLDSSESSAESSGPSAEESEPDAEISESSKESSEEMGTCEHGNDPLVCEQCAVSRTTLPYDSLMAAETIDEFEAIVQNLTDEELAAFTEDQLTVLQNRISELALLDGPEMPETISFTEAGPFLPPVAVETVKKVLLRRSLLAQPLAAEEDKLVSSKNLTEWDSETGTGKLVLEAYATGKYTTETVTEAVPTDVVLVLDQSGSMAYNFAGNSTSTNAERRQYAMKQAVNNFISAMGEKYSDKADHRLAIVTFDSDADVLRGWTNVNPDGESALKDEVDRLPDAPSGATRVDAGMKEAEELMGSGYSYTGTNTTRNKVVIVFTDGVPTNNTNFETSVATAAISSAKVLKDAGVTVYSIGIFNGVNPNELYGEKWDYLLYKDISCTGEVDNYWGGSWAASIFGRNDFEGIDIAAGNRFLNYLSTNYEDATEIGVERDTYNPGNHLAGDGTGYKITRNFTRTADADKNYYLTASNAADLNKIFESIQSQIGSGSTSVTLNAESVVRDVISPYFTVNGDTSGIKAYAVPSTGKTADGYQFDESGKTELTGAVTVTGKTIDASGFDFSNRYVAENPRTSGSNVSYYGEKLRIEIPIKVEDGFWGGSGVPTNDTGSGIFMRSDCTEAEYSFPTPTANVKISIPAPAVKELNVYYGTDGSALMDASFYDAVVRPTGADAWKDDYVETINYTVNGKPTGSMTEDATFTVTAAAVSGTLTGSSTSDSGRVNVFTPEITFRDINTYLGTIPAYSGNFAVSWKHATASGALLGTEPALSYTFNPQADSAVDDYYVKTASVGYGSVTIPLEKVSFRHTCGLNGCGFDSSKGQFLVHVFKPTVTWRDSTIYLGETADYADNLVGVVWRHGTAAAPAAMGVAPVLAYEYNVPAGMLEAETPVNVTVKIGGIDYTNHTDFDWQKGSDCITACEKPSDGEFVVHVKTCSLTVSKSFTANGTYDDCDTFLITVQGAGNAFASARSYTIALGTGSGVLSDTVTLTGLPIGTYTIVEEESWSWRYDAQDSPALNLSRTVPEGNAVITNNLAETGWLSHEASAANDFDPPAGGLERMAQVMTAVLLPKKQRDGGSGAEGGEAA